jgi:hypothetical protein
VDVTILFVLVLIKFFRFQVFEALVSLVLSSARILHIRRMSEFVIYLLSLFFRNIIAYDYLYLPLE